MHVFDLLTGVAEVVAVDVEKRLDRCVETLARKNLRHYDSVLAVDLDFDVVPDVRRPVVDGQTAAVKPERIDGRLARACEAQAPQQRCRHQTPQLPVRNHGLS